VVLLLVLVCTCFLVLPPHGLASLCLFLCVGGKNDNSHCRLLHHRCLLFKVNKTSWLLAFFFMWTRPLYHHCTSFYFCFWFWFSFCFIVLPPLRSCSPLSSPLCKRREQQQSSLRSSSSEQTFSPLLHPLVILFFGASPCGLTPLSPLFVCKKWERQQSSSHFSSSLCSSSGEQNPLHCFCTLLWFCSWIWFVFVSYCSPLAILLPFFLSYV